MPIKAVGVLNKRFPFAKTERIAPEKSCNPEIMFFSIAGFRTTLLFLRSQNASCPTKKTADPSELVLRVEALETKSESPDDSCSALTSFPFTRTSPEPLIKPFFGEALTLPP